jgi:hypothetical protein
MVAVPPDTSIPSWAFLDVVMPDTFNVTDARLLAAAPAPESSPAVAHPTSMKSSATQPAPNSSPTAAKAPPPPKKKVSTSHKSNIGPIVGGVVGGVVALLGGVVAYLYLRRRQRQRRAAAALLSSGKTDSVRQDRTSDEQDMYQRPQPGFASTGTHSPISTPPPPIGVLYNPDDPTTFPDASTRLDEWPHDRPPGRYTGLAEL